MPREQKCEKCDKGFDPWDRVQDDFTECPHCHSIQKLKVHIDGRPMITEEIYQDDE